MAGTFKKIAKLAGIAAAGTGIYTAGRQTGINEAGTPESTTGNQKAVTTSLERTPNIPLPGVGSSVEEANAYCRAVASAAQDSATMQKSASDLLRMRVEEPAKMPEPVVEVAQEPKEPTTLDRLKGWLTQLVKDVTE